MPLSDAIFESRTYRQILSEALARVPAHTPEWTNLSDADPGVTLLQLFAFLSENIHYRASLIPERNRLKFLRLLGMPMQAPEASRGFVAFSSATSAIEAITLSSDTEVRSGKIPFRTTRALRLLPIESRLYYKAPLIPDEETRELYRRLYASYGKEAGQEITYYETRVHEPPQAGVALPSIDLDVETVDGALWLALLAAKPELVEATREAVGDEQLTIGYLPALGSEGCALDPMTGASSNMAEIVVEAPALEEEGSPRYRKLGTRLHGDLPAHPGLIEIDLPSTDELGVWTDLGPLDAGVGAFPPSLEDTDDDGRLVGWLRISGGQQAALEVGWIGVNATLVVQRAHVGSETLPTGTGQPDQTATLSQTPVLLDSVQLTVDGEPWSLIDDLHAAPAEVAQNSPRFGCEEVEESVEGSRVYTLDRESGVLTFGDGAHGARPRAGGTIRVAYDYGGGVEGQVGIGTIKTGVALPDGVKVTNPVPSWGGDSGETVAEAEKRIPEWLRHRDRLVSEQDHVDIALRTPGVDVGRVEVLPLFHPKLSEQDSSGVVTVMVIPRSDSLHPAAPVPNSLFLETVCAYLSPRRVLTSELYVRGPAYVPVVVSIGIELVPGREAGPVREDVRERIEAFLSPLVGGFDEDGWPLDRAVDATELAAAAARGDGVAGIAQVLVGDLDGERNGPIELMGLELPKLVGLSVVVGDPSPVEDLLGQTEVESDPELVPVPVIPEEC